MTATLTQPISKPKQKLPSPQIPPRDFLQDDIRSRAYQIYLARCNDGGQGDALADWLRAEHEIKDQRRGETLLKGDQE